MLVEKKLRQDYFILLLSNNDDNELKCMIKAFTVS